MPGRSSPIDTGAGRDVGEAEPVGAPHRPVEHRVARLTIRTGDRLGEEHGVLVRIQVEVDVPFRFEGEEHGAEPPPGDEVG